MSISQSITSNTQILAELLLLRTSSSLKSTASYGGHETRPGATPSPQYKYNHKYKYKYVPVPAFEDPGDPPAMEGPTFQAQAGAPTAGSFRRARILSVRFHQRFCDKILSEHFHWLDPHLGGVRATLRTPLA